MECIDVIRVLILGDIKIKGAHARADPQTRTNILSIHFQWDEKVFQIQTQPPVKHQVKSLQGLQSQFSRNSLDH